MTALPALKDDGFTYQDYLGWPDQERWEIIHGEAFAMTPAPSTRHQMISRNLLWGIGEFKRSLGSCQVFTAPTDVVLDERTVVQPDLFIVCDKAKVTPKSIQGPPDLVIEIVSRATAFKDTVTKKYLYEEFGVAEYLLLFPDLDTGRYLAPARLNWDTTLTLHAFPVRLHLWEIFEREYPPPTSSGISSRNWIPATKSWFTRNSPKASSSQPPSATNPRLSHIFTHLRSDKLTLWLHSTFFLRGRGCDRRDDQYVARRRSRSGI